MSATALCVCVCVCVRVHARMCACARALCCSALALCANHSGPQDRETTRFQPCSCVGLPVRYLEHCSCSMYLADAWPSVAAAICFGWLSLTCLEHCHPLSVIAVKFASFFCVRKKLCASQCCTSCLQKSPAEVHLMRACTDLSARALTKCMSKSKALALQHGGTPECELAATFGEEWGRGLLQSILVMGKGQLHTGKSAWAF